MSPTVQAASQRRGSDEAHVVENRRLYRVKFAAFQSTLADVLPLQMPDAAFYFWAQTPIDDTEFALGLHRDYNVTVLPGSYLAREAHGVNPGANFVRIALVASDGWNAWKRRSASSDFAAALNQCSRFRTASRSE